MYFSGKLVLIVFILLNGDYFYTRICSEHLAPKEEHNLKQCLSASQCQKVPKLVGPYSCLTVPDIFAEDPLVCQKVPVLGKKIEYQKVGGYHNFSREEYGTILPKKLAPHLLTL